MLPIASHKGGVHVHLNLKGNLSIYEDQYHHYILTPNLKNISTNPYLKQASSIKYIQFDLFIVRKGGIFEVALETI